MISKLFLQYYVGGSFQISRIYKIHKTLHLKICLSNGKQLDKINLHTLHCTKNEVFH